MLSMTLETGESEARRLQDLTSVKQSVGDAVPWHPSADKIVQPVV